MTIDDRLEMGRISYLSNGGLYGNRTAIAPEMYHKWSSEPLREFIGCEPGRSEEVKCSTTSLQHSWLALAEATRRRKLRRR
ncbi:adenosylmethionine--8-amino-7-oxononanoate aminotransferase [Anopheles sinensis]|uniref:Adenosylmethionine--8-amino-7-oxononanoate aminotransferase n=1 Tax=Anopheles sinensis TaxID=74873 RepID=A0A084VIJ2_ANOSI|nr:adenosylmethionine--8-amino-7-oxononanoate aminotransferase [Anopheles sinensis]